MKLNKERTVEALVRTDFRYFLEKALYTASNKIKYIPGLHIEVIADEVQKIIEGKTKRLIINLPPRNLKSFTMSVATVAFMLGHDPSLNFICVSYNQDLADDFGLLTLKIMESRWYKKAFKHTRIDKRAKSKTNFQTTKGGGRYATSIEGTLTGRGADVIIIDDPIKPEDASSELQRIKVNNWFSSTLLSRLNDKEKGVIAVVMQRVHEDDLTGYLLETNESDWTHIKMPAIAVKKERWSLSGKTKLVRLKGQALHSEREPLSVLKKIKQQIGSYNFAGQYQQDPMPQEGGYIKRNFLHYYKENDLPEPDLIIQSWDTACKITKTSDYSVCTTWIIKEGKPRKYYLIDVFRKKLEFPSLRRKVMSHYCDFLEQYSCPFTVLIEDKASGTQLISDLHRENIPVKAFKSNLDKESRLISTSALFESGKVLLPKKARWLDEFINELLKFPRGKYDDQVDSATQALLWRQHWNSIVPDPEEGTVRAYVIGGERRRTFSPATNWLGLRNISDYL